MKKLLLFICITLLCAGCVKEEPTQDAKIKQDIPRGVAIEIEPTAVQESEAVDEEIPEDIAIYIGQYVYDSHTIIEQQNTRINTHEIENMVIQIGYNQKKECLTLFNGKFHDTGNFLIDIAEIKEGEPFFQYYGESAGYTKTDYYFQNGGITLVYEKYRFHLDDETESREKYVAYFKKV